MSVNSDDGAAVDAAGGIWNGLISHRLFYAWDITHIHTQRIAIAVCGIDGVLNEAWSKHFQQIWFVLFIRLISEQKRMKESFLYRDFTVLEIGWGIQKSVNRYSIAQSDDRNILTFNL